MNQHSKGQYFTKSLLLQEKVYNLILNDVKLILEPSVGRGDLVKYVQSKKNDIKWDMYEIDKTIIPLDGIDKSKIVYEDFLETKNNKKYLTIIGNPPYIKACGSSTEKKRNIYLDFIEKCYELLLDDGELIFIVPSDFLKLTSSCDLINKMLDNGCFTHIYQPNDEHLFENASIDIIIFRYQKTKTIEKKTKVNDINKYIINSNGMILFQDKEIRDAIKISDYFDIHVGLVSGMEKIYKHAKLGNVTLLTNLNIYEKYILIKKYPSDDKQINDYLLEYKQKLLKRKIRKFNENNWFEWGALRNIAIMEEKYLHDVIYIKTLSRQSIVATIGKLNYFGGSLLLLKPKFIQNKDYDKVLNEFVNLFNSDDFKKNFTYSGRFKIGHKQLSDFQIMNDTIRKLLFQ